MNTGNSSSTYAEPLLFGVEDSHAKTSQWLDNALAWLESGQGCGLSSEGLLRCFDRLGLSLRMSPACYPATEDATLPSSFAGWKSSGIGGPSGRLTLNTSVWPKDASVCSLSQVLETTVAPKYFLSAKACAGILRRAEKRGKELPAPLARALRAAAGLDQTLKSGGGLSRTLRAQPNSSHRADSETYIPTQRAVSMVGGGAGRYDGESETFVSHTLRSEGFDASEDGTGRGTPLVSIDLEHSRFTCLKCDRKFGVNDYESNTVTCPKCGNTGIKSITDVLPDNGDGTHGEWPICEEVSNTLSGEQLSKMASGSNPIPGALIAFPQNLSATQCASTEDKCPSLQAENPTAIAFDTTQISSAANYSSPKEGDPCHPLASAAHAPAVAFTERTRADGRNFESQEGVSYALTNPGSGDRTHSREIAANAMVRRLTPTECERLQGFPDGWTKEIACVRLSGNIQPCLLSLIQKHAVNAKLKDAAGGLLTGRLESASCIISGSSDTEARITLSAAIKPTTNAKVANCSLGLVEREGGAPLITNHGNGMVTLLQVQKGKVTAMRTGKDIAIHLEGADTWPLLSVQLEGPYEKEKESIISTWIRKTTARTIFGCIHPTQSTCEVIILWNSSQRNCSDAKSFFFGTEDTTLVSDSVRYRQLGNAVAVPVAGWIAKRLKLVIQKPNDPK